jgi:polysaccharide biosynthesis transport protein
VEAYKTIRTNLQFSLKKKTGNVVVITSTLPRDGKSTVAANVGVAFAQIGVKVLVIDADMRKPRLNKFFNISAVPGLSNYLAELAPLSDVMRETSYSNLQVIPSGILPPNPAELLSSSAMEDLINSLRNEYDLILMDTPSANIVSDAMVATKYSDGVVIVVRHQVTTHPEVEKTIKSFEFVNARIMGIVLNAVDMTKMYGKKYGAYGKYKYTYGGYGEDEVGAAVSEKLFDNGSVKSRTGSGN